ncbi:hypothetical protein BKA70DRAFT_1242274 [Coprinopsis sp. MPI-PUGE-AT-0042]|nr:hypothetical protein BKA70DRAFT_1242274 [Coprinopsis sp. MPI-PUGE-AT-0042]
MSPRNRDCSHHFGWRLKHSWIIESLHSGFESVAARFRRGELRDQALDSRASLACKEEAWWQPLPPSQKFGIPMTSFNSLNLTNQKRSQTWPEPWDIYSGWAPHALFVPTVPLHMASFAPPPYTLQLKQDAMREPLFDFDERLCVMFRSRPHDGNGRMTTFATAQDKRKGERRIIHCGYKGLYKYLQPPTGRLPPTNLEENQPGAWGIPNLVNIEYTLALTLL